MDHLNKKGRIFLVGIGGIGMSGIAEILHNLGYEVTGSDQKEGSNVIRLKKLGIKIKIGHNASNIKGSSLIVYSSAIKKQNVEIKEALKIKIPLISRAEMLAELMRMKKTITVAGSHGKTTTISIISEIFVKSELDPTVINGGIINSLGSNTRLGFGDWMIVETDESDGSFTKLPSFSGLITSIDDEHIDFYNNMRSLENAFEQYINNISVFGFSVICSDDNKLYKIATQQKRSDHFFYGTNARANYKAKNIRINKQGQTFDIEIKNINEKRKIYKNIQFPMHGRHNLLNALGAVAISHRIGISFKFIRQALKGFEGVKRRMTLIKTLDKRKYFDDYAHHPTEISSILDGINKAYSKRKIITVFEPHRYSRIMSLKKAFSKSFLLSDLVLICPLYAAGEKKNLNFNLYNFAKLISKNSKTQVVLVKNQKELSSYFKKNLISDEIVIGMGAGSISQWMRELKYSL